MNDSEFTKLKKEVAALKQQLRELSKFVCINGTASGKDKLVIRCSSIRLCDPDNGSAQITTMLEDPEALYVWGRKFVGFKQSDSVQEIDDKYWRKIEDYLGN